MNIKLHKFNPLILEKRRRLGSSPTILFIGKRGSGKSTLVSDILYNLRSIPAIVCMSGTEEGNGFYSKYIHEICIHNKFDQDVLGSVLEHQKKIVRELNDKGIDHVGNNAIDIGVLMDDLAYDKKIMKSPLMEEIFNNGRHYHITTMITFQYMMDIAPKYRTNTDFVFVCRENKKDNIERLYKYFFGIFNKFEDFKKVFFECTEDYGCLVLDCTSKSNKIEDQVFWYKAEQGHHFKIGTPQQWKMWSAQLKSSKKNDDDSEDEEDDNNNQIVVNTNKSIIRQVKKLGPKKVEMS